MPSHPGVALGVDRLLMIALSTDNIEDVISFSIKMRRWRQNENTFLMLIILLGLSACSSSVKSPLRSNQPVINIEVVLAPSLQVSANSSQLEVKV